jgi:hypothetical protein
MSTEDDRYGPPTHSCEYCSRCFPAKWEEAKNKGPTDDERMLVADITTNAAEIQAAIEHGCELFQSLSHRAFEQGETFHVSLVVTRSSFLIPLGEVGTYLLGSLVLRDEKNCILLPDDRDHLNWLSFLVYLPDGERCLSLRYSPLTRPRD